jgi:hypothetical protein
LTEDSTTPLQGRFYVLLASIGTDLSKRSGLPSSVILGYANMNGSIKEKLKSGEMYVRGDQWPLFLYADENFDPKRPWDGLLRNQILVLVRPCSNSGSGLTAVP